MKKEKVTKEITLTGNTAIKFGNPNATNGDMLIMGNFKNICGEANWNGLHSSENSWLDNLDMTRFSETIGINLEMIINTIRNGHKIIFIGSHESIRYWEDLLCNMMKMGYLTEDENPSTHQIKKILRNQTRSVETDAIYEDAARMYGDVKTTKSSKELNERIKNNINILFNNIKKAKMNFSNIVLNPPYIKSLHLEIFKNALDLLTDDGHLVIVEPATWLINVRRNGKAKIYDEIKKRINGHVKSVVIENLNKDFGTGLYVPFSITDIDMTYSGPIEFTCCGDIKIVKSLYDCNLIGDYKTIWGILEKVQKYGDMMKSHITKESVDGDYWYAKYAELLPKAGCFMSGSVVHAGTNLKNMFINDTYYRNGYLTSFFDCGFHTIANEISKEPLHSIKRGGLIGSHQTTDKIADNIYGAKQELENWRHFIFNNKLPLFLNIVLTIDQHNNSKEFLPWLVDKQYTDDEINKLFGFTEEEIKLMDDTLKKFERNSPWFKRYMCGKDSQDETTVPEPIVFDVSDFDNNLEDIKSMDEDTLAHEYPAWYSAWEAETNSGETDYSFRFWLNEQFEEQKLIAEAMEED